MSGVDPFMDDFPQRAAGHGPDVADVDLPFDADGLYELRATLAAHSSRLGGAGEQLDHLLIVASELATNVIRHGGGTGRLRLWQRDGVLLCQVSDHGPGIADPTIGTKAPDPSDSGASRGLWICRHLTTELTIETDPSGRGTVVTAAIADPDAGPGLTRAW